MGKLCPRTPGVTSALLTVDGDERPEPMSRDTCFSARPGDYPDDSSPRT